MSKIRQAPAISIHSLVLLALLAAGPSLALLFTVDVKIFIALLSEASGH